MGECGGVAEWGNGDFPLGEYGSCIEFFAHVHERDSGGGESVFDGAVDGSGTSEFGKEGGVDIEATEGRKFEDGRWEDVSVCKDEGAIKTEILELR